MRNAFRSLVGVVGLVLLVVLYQNCSGSTETLSKFSETPDDPPSPQAQYCSVLLYGELNNQIEAGATFPVRTSSLKIRVSSNRAEDYAAISMTFNNNTTSSTASVQANNRVSLDLVLGNEPGELTVSATLNGESCDSFTIGVVDVPSSTENPFNGIRAEIILKERTIPGVSGTQKLHLCGYGNPDTTDYCNLDGNTAIGKSDTAPIKLRLKSLPTGQVAQDYKVTKVRQRYLNPERTQAEFRVIGCYNFSSFNSTTKDMSITLHSAVANGSRHLIYAVPKDTCDELTDTQNGIKTFNSLAAFENYDGTPKYRLSAVTVSDNPLTWKEQKLETLCKKGSGYEAIGARCIGGSQFIGRTESTHPYAVISQAGTSTGDTYAATYSNAVNNCKKIVRDGRQDWELGSYAILSAMYTNIQANASLAENKKLFRKEVYEGTQPIYWSSTNSGPASANLKWVKTFGESVVCLSNEHEQGVIVPSGSGTCSGSAPSGLTVDPTNLLDRRYRRSKVPGGDNTFVCYVGVGISSAASDAERYWIKVADPESTPNCSDTLDTYTVPADQSAHVKYAWRKIKAGTGKPALTAAVGSNSSKFFSRCSKALP